MGVSQKRQIRPCIHSPSYQPSMRISICSMLQLYQLAVVDLEGSKTPRGMRLLTAAAVAFALVPGTAGQWERLEPGGATGCGRGSDFAFHFRAGTVNKLVIDFEGGGGCWDAVTCALPTWEDTAGGPPGNNGLASDRADNPTANWNYLCPPTPRTPACSWPVHLVLLLGALDCCSVSPACARASERPPSPQSCRTAPATCTSAPASCRCGTSPSTAEQTPRLPSSTRMSGWPSRRRCSSPAAAPARSARWCGRGGWPPTTSTPGTSSSATATSA